jgi:hypothetical protein
MKRFKEHALEQLAEAKVVKVPEFKTPEEMEKFLSKMHPDATPEDAIWDPETGEVFMQRGETKRKLAKKAFKAQSKSKVNQASLLWPWSKGDKDYFEDAAFNSVYNVVNRDYAKEVGSKEAENLRDNDYDVDFDYPAAIKRKDGQQFDEYDVDILVSYLGYRNYILPGRNIKILGYPKKGQTILKTAVELR